MITEVHPASSDRAEARKFGLCWHATPLKATWACFVPEDEAAEAPETIPAQKTAPADFPRVVQVTFREYDVFQELTKTGGTNTEIARQLYLSEDTVKSHMKKLLLRTGLSTRTELIVAHYRGRIRLDPRAWVGGGMIRPTKMMEDAL